MSDQQHERLLRLDSVLARTGFKRSKIYQLASDGRFPKPRRIEGCAVWPESEIERWIADRLAEC